MTKQVPLTKGLFALVDDADYETLRQSNWSASENTTFYAVRSDKHKKIYMHIEIMNPQPGLEVDHINGFTLDNRRKNLRICTHAQNIANGKNRKNNKSGYKGVSYSRGRRKWEAYIMVARKHKHLGYFPTATEAARAYNEAAIKYHGEFARLNIITRDAQNAPKDE